MDQATSREVLAAELSSRFPIFAAATIERLVTRTFDQFDDAPIQTYVPLLVRREAESRLRHLESLPVEAGPQRRPHRVA